MIICCFRDKVLNVGLKSGRRGVDEDETPRGKKAGRKGGIVYNFIFAVDLYFVVPNRVGWYAQMRRVQDHFANELTKWNSEFEYVKQPLSVAKPGETYFEHDIVKRIQKSSKAFAFEISEMDDEYKTFRYHGYYTVGAWRNKEGKPVEKPKLPYDWKVGELTRLAKEVTR